MTQPAMDFGYIRKISDGDADFERELLDAYLEDIADRVEMLRAAFANGNAEVLRREAHTINGASANVGTTQLHYLAQAIESADIATEAESLPDQIVALAAEFQRVKLEIEAHFHDR